MRGGIYCIENLKNGKKYIGQTVNLERRKHEHFWMLEGNNHDNGHLQNSYNKYGKNNFKFRVLLYCEPFELTKYEQIFVDYYTPKLLYNVRLECVNSNQGITLSEETKRKMSKAHKRENLSKETKRKMSEAKCGKHPSEETRKKMSEAGKKRKPISEETRKKLSRAKLGKKSPMYGKHHSEETIRKMSEAKLGKKSPMYGKHLSNETKEKMSKAKHGESHPNSKLTENQVFEILDLYYNKSKTQTDIAKNFPVNDRTISKIVKGKRWELCYKKFTEK